MPPKTRKSKKTLQAIEAKLLAERDDLLQQIKDLESPEGGTPIVDDDDVEPETATADRERIFTLVENAKELVAKVDHALEKIADETYGVCESCGKTIEAARLKVLPHASLCIACQREEERR